MSHTFFVLQTKALWENGAERRIKLKNTLVKVEKHCRNSKKKRNSYSDDMMMRAKTKFELIAGGLKKPSKKKLNPILKSVCLDFCYQEDYKKFRQALVRHLDSFKEQSHGVTGNKRGRPTKLTQEEEKQIVIGSSLRVLQNFNCRFGQKRP